MPKNDDRCSRLVGDFARIATIHGDQRVSAAEPGFTTRSEFKRDVKLFGLVLGPKGRELWYDVFCDQPRDGGKSCASYKIERDGPGAAAFKKTASVGNAHGLARQLARDAARAWGCTPPTERGFEGARRRKGSKRRR